MADIELVIKIPNNVYKAICDKNALGCDISDIKNVIRNGTPLPKGHGDLIDKKVVYKKFYSRCLAKVATEVFDETPTIIEADKNK